MKLTAATGSVAGLLGSSGQALTAWTYYNEPDGPTPLGPAELTFQDENAVRAFKGGVCVNNVLDEKGKEWLYKGPRVDHNEWKSLLDTFTYSISGKANGCVAISWEKEIWKEDYFKAKVRYEWVFTVGDESLVTYGLFNPEDQLHNIIWRTAYINRRNNRIAWIVRYIDKKTTPLKPGKEDKHWGFKPDDISNYGKLCLRVLGCVDDPLWRISGEEKWTWEETEEGQKRFTDWTKNFWSTFDYLVSNEYHKLIPFRTVANARKGIWTKR